MSSPLGDGVADIATPRSTPDQLSALLRQGECVVTLAGASVVLLPERAVWMPDSNALLVADLHWGKAAAFRAAHVPIPTGTTASDLSRLTDLINRTGATRLFVLGDLLHARQGRHTDTLGTISAWRRIHDGLAITLVRGNHDVRAGDPPPELQIHCTDATQLGPFALRHEPAPHTDGYVLSGHLHPHVTLAGRGKQHVRLPCFVFGGAVGVLPAFSSFTGGGMYQRADTDALYVIAGDTVLSVPARD